MWPDFLRIVATPHLKINRWDNLKSCWHLREFLGAGSGWPLAATGSRTFRSIFERREGHVAQIGSSIAETPHLDEHNRPARGGSGSRMGGGNRCTIGTGRQYSGQIGRASCRERGE